MILATLMITTYLRISYLQITRIQAPQTMVLLFCVEGIKVISQFSGISLLSGKSKLSEEVCRFVT